MKVKLLENYPHPYQLGYAHEGDSGIDLRSAVNVIIPVGSRALIPTGVSIELPQDCEGQIRPRSGLANMQGLMCNYGTIDNGYRGELCVIMFNFSDTSQTIFRGDRIAQLVISRVERPRITFEQGYLSDSARGEKGFGSTGVK